MVTSWREEGKIRDSGKFFDENFKSHTSSKTEESQKHDQVADF